MFIISSFRDTAVQDEGDCKGEQIKSSKGGFANEPGILTQGYRKQLVGECNIWLVIKGTDYFIGTASVRSESGIYCACRFMNIYQDLS